MFHALRLAEHPTRPHQNSMLGLPSVRALRAANTIRVRVCRVSCDPKPRTRTVQTDAWPRNLMTNGNIHRTRTAENRYGAPGK